MENIDVSCITQKEGFLLCWDFSRLLYLRHCSSCCFHLFFVANCLWLFQHLKETLELTAIKPILSTSASVKKKKNIIKLHLILEMQRSYSVILPNDNESLKINLQCVHSQDLFVNSLLWQLHISS